MKIKKYILMAFSATAFIAGLAGCQGADEF